MNNTNRSARVSHRERGSSIIEFMLCFALFWCPFFFGMWRLGISIIRDIQVTEVCRDAAHMLAYGIDFSDTANQTILQKVAQGMDISSTGQGVIILSYVTYVDSTACQAAGLTQGNNPCPNQNKHVLTRRIVVGNPAIRLSAFATPKAGDTDSSGNIAAATYLTDSTCVVQNFSPDLMTLSSGQYAYMAEMTLNSPDLGNRASSARSIF